MRRRTDERGAAAVEFALVLPILLAVVLAIITFGFLFAQDLALNNAARQTARYGVIQGRPCNTLVTEAQEASKPLVAALPAGKVTVWRGSTTSTATQVCQSLDLTTEEPCRDSAVNDNLYVRLSYQAAVLVPVPGLGSTQTVRSEGVFRCEFS